jgi:hypothetical protein
MDGGSFTFLLVLLVAFCLYFLPSIVASSRKHRDKNSICILNIFLGWTLLFWVICLVWAASGNVEKDDDNLDDLKRRLDEAEDELEELRSDEDTEDEDDIPVRRPARRARSRFSNGPRVGSELDRLNSKIKELETKLSLDNKQDQQ